MFKVLIIFILIDASMCELKDFPMPNYSTAISRIIIDYVMNFFVKKSSSVNIYQVSLEQNINVNLDILNEVLYNIKTKAIVQVDNLIDSKVSITKHFVNIIIVDCLKSFENVYDIMTHKTFEYQGFYLIVVTTHMDDIYTVMQKVFEALWTRHIINANILFMPPENIDEAIVYTFFPYSPFYCENVIPLQMNQYRDNQWINPVDYFPKKLNIFYGCPLRIATFPNPPFMLLNQDKKTVTIAIDGLDGTMLRVLSQHFNFSMQFLLSPELWGDIYDNGTVTGAIRMVVEEEVNMTLGFFATSPLRDFVMKSAYVYYTTNLVWIVPPGKPQTALQKLLNPLGPNLWISTSISIMIGFIAITILKRQNKDVQDFVFGTDMQSPGMNLVNIIFGGSLHHLPKRNFARFLMALFLIYTFILRSCYTGGLVKFMQMDTRGGRMQSTNEMINQNYSFYMLHAARSYLVEMPNVLKHIKTLSVVDYNRKLLQLTVDPYYDGAFLTSVGHLAYRNMMVFPHRFHHYAPESLYTLNIVIYMHRDSCLTSPFNGAITNLVNSGLVAKWASAWIKPQYLKPVVDESPVALSIIQLQGCFELLCAGLLTSFHVFLFEVAMSKRFFVKFKEKLLKTFRRTLSKVRNI